MELLVLLLLIVFAVAAGIFIASHFGAILVGIGAFVAIALLGTVAWVAVGMVVGVPWSFVQVRLANIPLQTRQQLEKYARWFLRAIGAILILWMAGAFVCFRTGT